MRLLHVACCLALIGCATGRMEPWAGTIVSGDTTLYVERAGAGADVILIEGGQLDLRLWDEVAPRLAEDFRVLRYDVRGFGRSAVPDGEYSHHEDLLALMDGLGIERAHLVGLSLGGRIALDAALVAPERVGRVVVSGPGISGWEWSDDGSWAEISAAVERGDARAAALAWVEHPYVASSPERAGLAERVRRLALANAHVWTRPQTEVELAPPAMQRLGEVRSPVLLMVGTEDVEDIQRIADLLEAGLTDMERRDVLDGGHLLPLEDPELFAQRVAEFLGR